MKTVILFRSDFFPARDNDEKPYFEHVLESLDIPEEARGQTDEITLYVRGFKGCVDEEGKKTVKDESFLE